VTGHTSRMPYNLKIDYTQPSSWSLDKQNLTVGIDHFESVDQLANLLLAAQFRSSALSTSGYGSSEHIQKFSEILADLYEGLISSQIDGQTINSISKLELTNITASLPAQDAHTTLLLLLKIKLESGMNRENRIALAQRLWRLVKTVDPHDILFKQHETLKSYLQYADTLSELFFLTPSELEGLTIK